MAEEEGLLPEKTAEEEIIRKLSYLSLKSIYSLKKK